MKTYLINSIKQVSVNSQSWDTISTLKSQEWIVYNEDISQVEKFLFIDDMKLLVSVNGKSSYSDNGIYTGKIKCKLDHGVRWHGRPVRAVKD